MIEINKKLSFSYKKAPLIIAEISGNHKQIQLWKLKMSEKLTKFRRPDLWLKYIKS